MPYADDEGDITDDEGYITHRQFQRWARRREEQDREERTEINAKLDTVVTLLRGDGSEDKPGVLMRLDRVERSMRSGERIRNWIASGGLGALGVWLFNQFTRNGS